MKPPKGHRLVPPDENCCIWMTAGILSYQLCDRELNCDSCPLDAAMRKQFPRRAEPVVNGAGPERPRGPREEGLREGYWYSRNHCWMLQIAPDRLRVGVEPGMGRVLLTPKAIVFPTRGQALQKGQTCLWIVMEGGTMPLESPCDGVVRATNSRLAEHPHLIQSQPFDEGWLLELQAEANPIETGTLLEAERIRPEYAASEHRFQEMLDGALRKGHPSVGPTLTDGGEPLQNIADILGPSRYFAIVRRAYKA